MRIGIFDHGSIGLGGAQIVAAQMAVQLSRGHEVEFIHCGEGYSLSSLAKAFEVDLSRVRDVLSVTHMKVLTSQARFRHWPICGTD